MTRENKADSPMISGAGRGGGKISPKLIRTLIVGLFWNLLIFGAPLFLLAGTFDWPRAWALLAIIVVGATATMLIVFPGREDLLDERLKSPVQEGQPTADKVLVLSLIAAFVGLIVFIPLDVFRFHWFGKPEAPISALGLGLFIAGWLIISLVFRENAFAAPVVKRQEERGHSVVDTGVYGVVRHPMYVGVALLMIGMALWLESYAAALLSLIPIGILAARILVEENFLKRELKGYEAYMRKVRYRLIPYVW
jgi:protein-S-isoprenylcysteine O-methyltransferase Ste14